MKFHIKLHMSTKLLTQAKVSNPPAIIIIIIIRTMLSCVNLHWPHRI